MLFTATDGSIKLAFLAGHIPRRCASNVRIPLALAWRHELGVRQMATKSPILLYYVQALLRRQLALWVPPIVIQTYSQSTWTTNFAQWLRTAVHFHLSFRFALAFSFSGSFLSLFV